jgi:hypothetical protein|tara:strand:- start:1266 stop:1553 length:288 start_codon:yes stop_codon:yes gene_type:complete
MAHSSNVPHQVIDSVTKMDTAFGHVLIDKIVDTFGIALFQGRMPDPDAFMAYLVGNALLHDAITDIHIKLQSSLALRRRKKRRRASELRRMLATG